jgi:hypothetical protein
MVWALVPSMDGGDAHAATMAAAAAVPSASDGFAVVLNKAVSRAFKGGVAGFTAGVMQVFAFMWLRTSMNYQYVNGGGLREALKKLYAEGGVKRFYQGVGFAVVQAPLSRFGDTAANAGVLLLLDIYYPEVIAPYYSTRVSSRRQADDAALTPPDARLLAQAHIYTHILSHMGCACDVVACGVRVLWRCRCLLR